MSDIKKLGILTSGGDCAGLNTAIAAATKKAVLDYGWEVYGIYDSTAGLMQKPIKYTKLHPDMFDIELFKKGGTFLGTVNKGDPFNYPMPDGTFKDRSSEIMAGYRELGLDALIAIGGDGSMRIIEKLTSMGNIKFIGIPKTIDNDVAFTNYSIGFISAVDVASNCIERLHDTALSHRRVMIIETMGREVGHIALNAGICGKADVILIPEIPYDINVVINKIKEEYAKKQYAIVVCSEAVFPKNGTQSIIETRSAVKKFAGAGDKLGSDIEILTGIETRVSIPGHIQRGGSPTAFDRILASSFGVKAVELLKEGKTGRLVGINSGTLFDVDLSQVTSTQRAVEKDDYILNTARGLGICLGE